MRKKKKFLIFLCLFNLNRISFIKLKETSVFVESEYIYFCQIEGISVIYLDFQIKIDFFFERTRQYEEPLTSLRGPAIALHQRAH